MMFAQQLVSSGDWGGWDTAKKIYHFLFLTFIATILLLQPIDSTFVKG